MAMPGRTYAVGGHKYKYGFNGKELDDEIAEGDYDFDERMYDSRIGRFFSTDPCEEDYPSFSPYCFAANNPILFVDVDGCGPGNPWLEALSVALDFVPGVGTVKNLVEAAVGYDLAGNKLEAWERIAMIVPGGALANKAFKAGKAVVKQVLKHADDIARISKKVFTKVVAKSKKIFSKSDKVADISEQIVEKIDRKRLNPPKAKDRAPTFKEDKSLGIEEGEGVDIHHVDGTMEGHLKEMRTADHMAHHKKYGRPKISKKDDKLFNQQRKNYYNKEYKWHHRKVKFKNKLNNIRSKIKKAFKRKKTGKVGRLRSKM